MLRDVVGGSQPCLEPDPAGLCVVAVSKEIECSLVATCDLSASLCFLQALPKAQC